MKSLLVQIDDPTFRALSQVAPPKKRMRSEFIRAAIRKAIWQAEEERMRLAYLAKPDSEDEADAWLDPEEWKD